jgi:hypothetical protein
MSLDISSSSSGDGELRSAHEGTAGYKLRTRSRETRIKMAKMARAMCEEDDDELSESKTRITIKRPRSYVRTSATRRERTRMRKLNVAYDRLRKVVPNLGCDSPDARLSKIATLRLAIEYITVLTDYLRSAENDTIPHNGTDSSADEDNTSSAYDESKVLAELINSVVEEFGWFLGRFSQFIDVLRTRHVCWQSWF